MTKVLRSQQMQEKSSTLITLLHKKITPNTTVTYTAHIGVQAG